MAGESEYGGGPGIIQPESKGHPSTQETAVDREGVADAAMVVRYAGLREARGIPYATVVDPATGVADFVQYDEEMAREDLTTGKNGL